MGMYVTPTELAVLAVALLLLHRLASNLLLARRNRAFAKAHNCKPPVRHESGFFGIAEFRRILASDVKKEHVQYLTGRWRPGKHTFVMSIFGSDIIQTVEPENIKTILATGFADWCLGKTRKESFHDMLGDGIFTLDGKGWEYSRALLRPQFSRDQVADVAVLDVHVSRLLALMESAEGNPDGVDLQPWFFGLTLDSATEFLFGESANSLIASADDLSNFAHAFNEGQKWIIWRMRWSKFISWSPSAMKKVNSSVHSFVDRYVHMALNRDKFPLPEEAQKKYIFLDAVAQHTRDPKALRDQMLNILLAGRDTTAGLIGWTFYLLSRDPRVYSKLRSELESTFGTSRPGIWRRPTFEDLKSVTYLRHVLNEVLRLYPSVPLNTREAVRNTTLPVGGGPDGRSPVFVPEGSKVQYSVYSLHRREDIYGADACEFRPERWEEKTLGRAWEYLPFNGGPRICLGQQYALVEASFAVLRILQVYERMEAVGGGETVEIDATLTMAPRETKVRLFRARAE